MADKQTRPELKELVREFRRSSAPRRETRVAVPLPPAPARVARALDPIVRGGGPDRLVDALELTRVFNLDELSGREEEEGDAGEGDEREAEAGPEVDRLKSVPLFGALTRAACTELAAAVHRRALGAGEILFYEGQPARSFFIVVEGSLEVVRARGRRRATVPTPLTRAGPNEVLGVFGLFSGRRRAATLRAARPSVLLEVPGTALARLVQHHASARRAVRRFYQERLLTVFLASSPIFGELPEAVRAAIVKRFEAYDVKARTTLVVPGEVTNGLFLVMNGQLVLRRHAKDEAKEPADELMRLGRGQFFGVVSAMVGAPTTSSATAVSACSLAVLSHRQFAALLQSEPSLRSLPTRLREEGLLIARDVFVGDTGVPGLGGS